MHTKETEVQGAALGETVVQYSIGVRGDAIETEGELEQFHVKRSEYREDHYQAQG